MRISDFLLYVALIFVVVLAINQLQKPSETSVVYVPSRLYGNWGWGRSIGYNGRGYGHHWGGYGGGRGGCGRRKGYSGH
jgi:hypothetical protein